MLCTRQKVLRRFWYATLPIHKLRRSSRSVRVWIPTVVSAVVLVLMFLVTSSHLS